MSRERYAPEDELEQVASDDNTLSAFSRAQGMGNISWRERVFARLGDVKGLSGRERKRAMMKALGFELR